MLLLQQRHNHKLCFRLYDAHLSDEGAAGLDVCVCVCVCKRGGMGGRKRKRRRKSEEEEGEGMCSKLSRHH